MKKFMALFLGAVLLFSLCACASSSGTNDQTPGSPAASESPAASAGGETPAEATTLYYAFNGSGTDASVYDGIFDEYEKENPGITVETIFIPMNDWPEFISKVQTMIAGGTELDVCHITNESTPVFYGLGMLECMDPYIEKHPDWFACIKDIAPMCQKTFVKDGKTYGVAKDWNNVVMHINTDMLKEAGLEVPDGSWTPEVFLDYCKKLTVKNSDGSTRYAFAVPMYYFGVEAWFLANGGRIFNEDFSESTINSPKIVQVVQFWQDLIFKYGYSGIPSYSDDAATMFVNEQVAMHSAGHWSVASYLNNKFSSVAVQTLPVFDKENYKVINGVGGSGVLNTSKNKE